MKESPELWISQLKDPDEEIQHQAKLALGGLTFADAEFVPQLIRALRSIDPESRFWAATALAGIGPGAADAVPDLVLLLKDGRFGNRQAAAGALERIGPPAGSAVSALVETLKSDPEPYVRQDIVRALGGIGTAEAVKALIEALEERDNEIRRYAAISLKMLGPRAKEAIPALEQMLEREKVRAIRNQVEAALSSIAADG